MKTLLVIPAVVAALAIAATGAFGATLAAGGGARSLTGADGTPGPQNRAPNRAYDPHAYVYGGATPRVAASIQTLGYTPQATSPAPVLVAVPQTRSFSWPDAGVGAGTVFGVIALLAGSTLVVLRRRGHEAI
jgi:hypothetical protein